MTSTCTNHTWGKVWKNELGQFHREKGPAVETNDGTFQWWLKNNLSSEQEVMGITRGVDKYGVETWKNASGQFHRLHGPAYQDVHGQQIWYVNGKVSRADGPAWTKSGGTKEWWVDGQRNREGGPAVEQADGCRQWFVHGKRHNPSGPAVDFGEGRGKEYWLHGIEVNEQDVASGLKLEVGSIVTQIWRNSEGKTHRTSGPAITWSNGSLEWWVDGQLHREGGKPALVFRDGRKEWHVRNVRHRDGGPAIECPDGTTEYWLDGKEVIEEEVMGSKYEIDASGSKIWKNAEGQLHRVGGPAVIRSDGTQCFYQNGLFHNDNGPAYISGDGETVYYYRHGKVHRDGGPARIEKEYKIWYKDDKVHNLKGPAVVCSSGKKTYYVEGKFLSKREFEKLTMTQEEKDYRRTRLRATLAYFATVGTGLAIHFLS